MTQQELQEEADACIDKPFFDEENRIIGKIVGAWVQRDCIKVTVLLYEKNLLMTTLMI